MGELDITIHTRDIAPCFSATPSHCQIVNWRAYPETPSRAHALRKNARGAYWLRSRGAYWQHTHTYQQRPISPALCRKIVDRNLFMSTCKRIVAQTT